MRVPRILLMFVLGLGPLEGCSMPSEKAGGTPALRADRLASEAFKRGGRDRAKAWESLKPSLAERVRETPKTKTALSAFFEEWLGPCEPDALRRCKALVEEPQRPQAIKGDVFCYLLSDQDGTQDYLVVDFRRPDDVQVKVATMVDAPVRKHSPLPPAELEIAKHLGAVEVNVAGAGEDGCPKPGWSIWLKDSEASSEDMRKAAQISTLVAVLLTGKNVTDEWLAPIKSHPYLTSVRLFETSVTDEGLTHLSGLKSLKSLHLKDCAVTEKGIASLKAALPACRVLRD